jgi:hypothetical protein
MAATLVWRNESKLTVDGLTENNAAIHAGSCKDEFPYWEWYGYGSSVYLKMYTNRTILRFAKRYRLRERIYILSKLNWFYVPVQIFYLIYKKIDN